MATKRTSEGSDTDSEGCLSAIREEFRCSNFGLSHPRPWLLVSDQWGYPKVYLGWRVFWALYYLSWIVYIWVQDGLTTERPGVWLVYLTNWTFLVLTLNTIVQAAVVVAVTVRRTELQDDKTPWYLKMTWLLYEVASVNSVLVTILYFGLLFDGKLTLVSAITHLINSVYVILDICVTATPVRLFHVSYSFAYGCAYIIFTVVYWAAEGVNSEGNRYVYEVLDWSKVAKAAPIAVGCGVIGVPMVHLLVWTLYMIRCAVHRNCCRYGCVGTTTGHRTHPNGIHPVGDSSHSGCNDCPV